MVLGQRMLRESDKSAAKTVAWENGALFIWQHTEREMEKGREKKGIKKGRRETLAAATHFI